ncbi:uncharacterized protein SPPG_05724 [Spizellomyces punctatus DAOM BR117]|uniref:NodB homology domain-containing protein n=1 Tax=Spizellomyces punctatus (strain DAOM BR117) TaxID=645134 RepID=A0A0L0HCU8_SPIPD|nr:uncharacterized protein SPPG_05724 [Spizellomyces punctatus DAOM BR117]KNC98744.1 hypothetical protein SPPG_05724 [Spizellomyces punctatus DAOM BR117]|eukprot:XP_016606784.1 hypothetical protein SPPG_05724 [Spizellomyces punctatus DAOM BR117]
MHAKFAAITALVTLLGANAQKPPSFPPQVPAAYPPYDDTKVISEEFIKAPLVQEAIAYVKAVVPADVLAIKPSTYQPNTPEAPKYNDDPVKRAYWPATLATRPGDVVACPGDNQWGLTYDDGPTTKENSPGGMVSKDVRDALKAANLKATFFLKGAPTKGLPEEVKATIADGHEVAIHTWTHHPLTSLTNEQIVAELKYTEAAIFEAVGKVPAFYRPPYGDVDDRVRAIATALGYQNIMWTREPDRDTHDAAGPTGAAVRDKIVKSVKDSWFKPQKGFISLEHDVNAFVSEVGVTILKEIKAAGANLQVKPQPIGQCLNAAPYRSGPVGANQNPPTGNTVPVPGGTVTTPAGDNNKTATPSTTGTPAGNPGKSAPGSVATESPCDDEKIPIRATSTVYVEPTGTPSNSGGKKDDKKPSTTGSPVFSSAKSVSVGLATVVAGVLASVALF